MSGHSKWKTIQHKKGAADAKRGKIFAKLGKEIFVAAKNGDPNPENNPSLRLAIDKAKAQSMPKDNIERAIARASGGKDGANYEELIYEGYGPYGVAIMIECLTDNRNRTAAFVKATLTKRGGNLGSDGAVSYLFTRVGSIIFSSEDIELDMETFELALIDFDILDYTIDDGIIEIQTTIQEYVKVKNYCDEFIDEYLEAEITMVPQVEIDLEIDKYEKIQNLIETLEDNDDVQNVFSNIKKNPYN